MFIKVVDYKLDEPSATKTKSEALYECHTVHRSWVERKEGDTIVKDVSLTMEGGGNITLQIAKRKGRKGVSIYFMNNAGRTIDSIQW